MDTSVLNSGEELNLGAFDRADSDGHESSQVFTSLEEQLGVPVSLQSGNVGLDFLLVEGVVLGKSGRQLGRVSEDLGPGLDGCDVLVHVFAGVEGLWDLQGHQAEIKSSLGVIIPAALLDISDTSLNLLSHELATGVAGLDLGQMVVAGHAVDESSDEISCAHDTDVSSSCGLDGSNSDSHQSSQIVTSLEEILCIPIGLKSGDVGQDFLLVESVVLGKSGGQLGRVGEDLGPGLDGCDVTVHVLAGAQRLRDLQGRQSELKSSLGIVVPAALLDVLNAVLNLLVHELSPLEAGFDLSQVIVTGHSIDEAGNEVSGCFRDTVLCVDTANHNYLLDGKYYYILTARHPTLYLSYYYY